MKYIHKETQQVAVDAKYDEKFKTYTLIFEDGTQKPFSASTIKRWWKPIKEDDVEEVSEPVEVVEQKEVVSEDVSGDGTPLAEVGKEIAAQAVEKAKAAKKSSRKKCSRTIEERQNLIIEQIKKVGLSFVITEKSPKSVWILDENNKKTRGVYVGDYKCVLGLPAAEVPDGYKADRVRNQPMSHSFDISYESMDRMSDILANLKTIEKEEK